MNIYYLETEIYKNGEKAASKTLRATVNAPNLHWAKRLMVQDVLAHAYWIKSVQVFSPEEEHQIPPWGESGESNG